MSITITIVVIIIILVYIKVKIKNIKIMKGYIMFKYNNSTIAITIIAIIIKNFIAIEKISLIGSFIMFIESAIIIIKLIVRVHFFYAKTIIFAIISHFFLIQITKLIFYFLPILIIIA